MDLAIPDAMLKSFTSRYQLSPLLNDPSMLKKKAVYEHKGQTWRATIEKYEHCDDKQQQLTIRLSHNGFRYHKRKFVTAGLTTHKRDSWFALGPDVLEDMPHLKALKSLLAATITFAYNFKYKRIDISFFKDDHPNPFLLVTFEPGHPEKPWSKELRF